MIRETVTITDRKLIVSYSGEGLSLTPEMEARLMEFWKRRIDRITAEVLGCPGFGAFSGNALPTAAVPEREHESPKGPYRGSMFPSGNVS